MTGMSGESGLANLAAASNVPAHVRAQDREARHYSGEKLGVVMDRQLIGVFADSGAGKTHTIFSMLEDSVELRAHDDDYISRFFSYNPELRAELLKADEKTRRSYLRAAHKVIVFDFDKMGAQPLFQSQICNPALFSCVEYFPIADWEEAYAGFQSAVQILNDHAAKWGTYGCWWVIDNAAKAWSWTQADYVQAKVGRSANEFMMDIRMKYPGRDSAARSVQADKINDVKEWAIINPAHNEEWFDKMIDSGFNMLCLSPPKELTITVGEMGGKSITKKTLQLGGNKNNRYGLHYIWEKYVSEDGHTFWGELNKTRYTGQKGKEVSNPTYQRMRQEQERVEKEHGAAKQIRHAEFDYHDLLPSIGAMPAMTSSATLDRRVPVSTDPMGDVAPMPGVPEPTTPSNGDFPGLGELGGDLWEGMTEVPIEEAVAATESEFNLDDLDIDLEMQQEATTPVEELNLDDIDFDVEMETQVAEAVGAAPEVEFDLDDLDLDGGILCQFCNQHFSHVNSEGACKDCAAEIIEEGARNSDVISLDALDDLELQIDDIDLNMEVSPLEPDAEIDLSDLELPDLGPESEETETAQEMAPETPEDDSVVGDGPWVVSAKDKGRGRYHMKGCKVLKRVKEQKTIFHVDEIGEKREACPTCLGEDAPAPAPESSTPEVATPLPEAGFDAPEDDIEW